MRQRSLMAVCIGLVLAGGAVAWRISDRRAQLHERLTEWEEMEQVETQLDQPVQIRLVDTVDAFHRQTGLHIVIHGTSELFSPDEWKLGDFPETLPARQVLDQFSANSGCAWQVDESGVIGFYPYESQRLPPTIRTYSLDQSISPLLQRQIAEALRSVIEPDSWSDVGGGGELIASPGQLLIAQRYDMHERIREFLARFQRALQQSAELPASGMTADDPRLQSAALTGEANQFERTHAALNERVSFAFIDLPLKDCLARLSEMIDMPIVIPMRVEGEIYLDQAVTLQVVDVRLSTALELLLHPQGAFVVPTIDGAVLKVVTVDQEQSPENMVWRAYPVPDFRSTVRPQFDPLAELLMSTVDMDSWQDVGGPGSVQRIGNLLLVSQSNRTHQKIGEILHALRIVRSGKQPFANIRRPSVEREQILQKLQQPLALRYSNATLREFAASLSERTELRVVLKGIEEAGLSAESKITCDLYNRPLEENLHALFRRHDLGFEVHEDCLVLLF